MNITAVGDQLRQYIEKIERLDEDRRALQDDIKEIFAEAKGNGFDAKIMRQIVRLRRMEKAARDEAESLLETYKAALSM